MKPQFSLRSMIWAVTLLALSCALLAEPSYFAAQVVWSLAVGILAMAIVAAIARRGKRRAFWATFAFFGWGHMLLALAPGLDDSTGEFLLSRRLLDWLGHVLGHQVADIRTMPGIWQNLSYAHDIYAASPYDYLTYLVIGQSLISLMLAYVAGIVAADLFSYADSAQDAPSGTPINRGITS